MHQCTHSAAYDSLASRSCCFTTRVKKLTCLLHLCRARGTYRWHCHLTASNTEGNPQQEQHKQDSTQPHGASAAVLFDTPLPDTISSSASFCCVQPVLC